MLSRENREVVTRQEQRVFGSLAQCRQRQRDHIEAIKEIFAEAPGAHLGFEIAVGRRDESDIRLSLSSVAKPLIRLVVEKTQETDLGIGGQLTNLVEEQRSTLGLLDLTSDVGDGTGEGPSAMPEQGAGHQVARKRRTIHRYERCIGTRAVDANPAREHVLAGAAFAAQQEHGIRCGRARDRLKESDEYRAPRLEERRLTAFVQFLLEFCQSATESLGFDHATGGQPDLIGRERLRHVVDGAPPDRIDGALDGGECSDNDHPQLRLTREHFRNEIEPGIGSEPEVEKDDLEVPALQSLEGSASGRHTEHARTGGLQAEPQ